MAQYSLFSNAGYLMGVDIINSLGGFLFWGIGARVYSPEIVGIAAAVLSSVTFIASLAGLGLGIGLIRFLPESMNPNRLINTSFTLNFTLAFFATIIFLMGLPIWSPSLQVFRGNNVFVIGLIIFAIVLTLESVGRMVYVARKQSIYAFISALVVNVLRIILIVLLLNFEALGLIASIAIAIFISVLLQMVIFLPKVIANYRLYPSVNSTELKLIVPYSAGNYLAVLIDQTAQTVLLLFILEVLGPASTGHASIALLMRTVLVSPGIALTVSAFAEGSNQPERLDYIIFRAVIPGFILTAVGAMVIAGLAPWLLSFFGSSYSTEGTSLLRWLAIAAPLMVFTNGYFTRLRVNKRTIKLIFMNLLIAVMLLSVSLFLLPRVGIVACGIGWFVAYGLISTIILFKLIKGGILNRANLLRELIDN